MSKTHTTSRKMLFLASILAIALAVPSIAMAAVGGPYSESASNPEDNGVIGPSGGSLDLHGFGMLEVSAGALAANTSITAQVWNVAGGPTNPDGSVMRTAVEFQPDGTTFSIPALLSLNIPAGIKPETAAIYAWNTTNSSWTKLDGARNGDRVTTEMGHFSWYGIGGQPIPTTSTPATSSWSVALMALGALVVAALGRSKAFSLR